MGADIYPVIMPKWGMEMSEGDIVEWHCEIGDSLNFEEDLLDVETSKIINTVTVPTNGVLRAKLADVGETLEVGALLAVIADHSVSESDINAFITQFNSGSTTPDSDKKNNDNKTEESAELPVIEQIRQVEPESKLSARTSDIKASPVADRLSQIYDIDLSQLIGTGRHGRVSKKDVEKAAINSGRTLRTQKEINISNLVFEENSSYVPATPIARRLAKKYNIDLNECRRSGNRGRVSKYDVESLLPENKTLSANSGALNLKKTVENSSITSNATPSTKNNSNNENKIGKATPLSNMRSVIAQRLQDSKQSAPHYRVQTDVFLDDLLATRSVINEMDSSIKISVNDILIKACASALMCSPKINIQFDGSNITPFSSADISVAVAVENGLITPIIKNANEKGLGEISTEMRDLANRAKKGKLKSHEYQGGSFSISNLGMFDVTQFDAIINPPQAAILAVGSGQSRPVVEDGEIKIRTVLSLTLSSDHRVIDGADAAQFLSHIKRYIETPTKMLTL